MIADEMEYIYSIYIGEEHIASIYKMVDVFVGMKDIEQSSSIKKVFFDNKMDIDYDKDEVVEPIPDEPLRELSSQPYLINSDKEMIYEDVIYVVVTNSIPMECRYCAMPILQLSDIIDYTIRNPIDSIFIEQGYVRELSSAKHVIMPGEDYVSLGDFLIEKVDGDTLVSFDSRKTVVKNIPDSIYISVSPIPVFTGDIVHPPYTYTPDSLISKTKILNIRLQKYGSERVRSILQSLQCVSQKLISSPNQYASSTLYDKVVNMVMNLK
jgi:hypothetical protein